MINVKYIGYYIPSLPDIPDDKIPDMFFDGDKRTWTFKFAINDILDYVNVATTTEARRNPDVSVKTVATDEDKDLILTHVQAAVSNVAMILARRMEHMPVYASDQITFVLSVSENHDDTMVNILYWRIMDYLCQYALRKWYGTDIEPLNKLEDRIRSAIHFRKHGITRKIRYLF